MAASDKPSSDTPTSDAPKGALSIGEVLNLLKEDFDDITVSKIRFLESENLIEPKRTASGYRRFANADVERLKFILTLQRDQFLPLRVIRDRLVEFDTTKELPSVAAAAATKPRVGPKVSDFLKTSTGVSMSRSELCRAASIDEKTLGELESFGLLRPTQTTDGETRYDESCVEVAKVSTRLLVSGLEPRHLRLFSGTVDRWVALADQLVEPFLRQKNPESTERADALASELIDGGNRLIQALMRQALSSRRYG